MKARGSCSGLFYLLNHTPAQGSDDDSEILNSFTQQFSGIFQTWFVLAIM